MQGGGHMFYAYVCGMGPVGPHPLGCAGAWVWMWLGEDDGRYAGADRRRSRGRVEEEGQRQERRRGWEGLFRFACRVRLRDAGGRAVLEAGGGASERGGVAADIGGGMQRVGEGLGGCAGGAVVAAHAVAVEGGGDGSHLAPSGPYRMERDQARLRGLGGPSPQIPHLT